MHTGSSSRILQRVPSHYPWLGSQRQGGFMSQEVLPPCQVPAAWLGLPVLGTRNDLCRGGLDPAGPHVAVSQHAGAWLSEEMPAAFLPKPGSAGTRAERGQLVPNPPPLHGLCSAPGVQSLFSGSRELLGAGGQDGKETLAPASSTSAALPEPLPCGEGKNSQRPGSFVRLHQPLPAQAAQGTWGRSFLMLTSCVTVGLGQAPPG